MFTNEKPFEQPHCAAMKMPKYHQKKIHFSFNIVRDTSVSQPFSGGYTL